MSKPIRILLQTTVPTVDDGWDIRRFSMLRDYLSSLKDENDNPLCEVTVRDRETDAQGDDPVLSHLDTSDFDELWLFAIDTGDGLSENDCAGITKFRQRGGGILATRDHQDLGSSLCTLGGIGAAHYFHSRNQEPDAARHCPDDSDTKTISWPNYHSGSNGDYQHITPVEPLHELLQSPASTSGMIEFFPAHPHEGAVGIPENESAAQVIATGRSLTTGKPFNLIVAFDRSPDAHGNLLGRGIAESSFHHFADYNWDINAGCPSFLEEPPGDGIARQPHLLQDIKTYMHNLALWLAPQK
jgi:hypothetical protein